MSDSPYRHGDAGYEIRASDGRVLGFRQSQAAAKEFADRQSEPANIVSVAGARSASIVDALEKALGKAWTYDGLKKFNTYLIARRSVEEWKRWLAQGEKPTEDGKGLQRRPMRNYANGSAAEEIAAIERVVRDYDDANPNFAAAAQMVYDFLWAAAIHDHQAGRLSEAELDYRATRKHFYVPFGRAMSEATSSGLITARAKHFQKDKAFEGSDRSIIAPIESILDKSFQRAAATYYNDVVRAIAKLADTVGPSGARIAERVTQRQILEANAAGFAELERKFQEQGFDAEDAREMVKDLESDFGDTQLMIKYDPSHPGPEKPVLLTLYENGERQYVRINDPVFAKGVFDSVNNVGRELAGVLIEMMAKPSSFLRWGVTTNPAFIGPNIVRDAGSAWILTGSLIDPRTWPVVTQVRGLYHEMMQTEYARLYQEVAGLMGGQNVAALHDVKDKADVMELQERGMRVKALPTLAGAVIGGTIGFMLPVPGMAVVGAMAGAALHRGPRRFFDTLAHFSDLSETATRLGVFAHGVGAARRYNPSLTPYQAAQEAAYLSRDLIDFGRRGSGMLAAAKLVPFMNANIQGLDTAWRKLLARSDRGQAFSTTKLMGLMAAGAATGLVAGTAVGAAAALALPVLATNLAARTTAVRTLLQPWYKKNTGLALSRDEEKAVADSARVWTNLMLMTLGFLALTLINGGGDDREYRAFKYRYRFKNQPVKIEGQWYSFPKPFEWAVPHFILEAAIEAQFGGDPRFWERVRSGMNDVLVPPGIPQTVKLWRDIGTGINSYTGRPLVPEYHRADPPELQFNAYASQFAIGLAGAVNRSRIARGAAEGVGGFVFNNPNFEVTPAIIDHALTAGMGYWGRDTQRASNVATIGAGRVTDYPLIGTIVQRFSADPARLSDAMETYWQYMGVEHGGYRRAYNGYRTNRDLYGGAAANAYLATLQSAEQRAYAILMNSSVTADRRQHPLTRVAGDLVAPMNSQGIVSITSSMERDIVMRRLADTSNPQEPKPIRLNPAKAAEVRDALANIRAIEVENAFIAIGHEQFAGRSIIPVQPALNVLRAASPEAYAEYMNLLERNKIEDFAPIAAGWPRLRDQLLRTWQERVDRDAGDALRRPVSGRGRPPIIRPPIGGSAPEAEPSSSFPWEEQTLPGMVR